MSLVAIRTLYPHVTNVVSSGSASLTPGPVAASTVVTATVAVAGSSIGDIVSVSAPGVLGNVVVQGEVTAAGTVTIKFANATAGSITPAAGIYKVLCETFTSEVV